MFLNSKNNNFILLFPPDFYSKELEDRYKAYYNQMLLPYDKLEDFMSASIQSIDFPGWTMEGPQQIRMYGAKQEFKSSTPIKDLITRKFTVTFKLADAYMNYLVFLDNAIHFLDFKNKQQYFEGFKLCMLNNEGYLVSYMDFKKVLLNGMSDFKLAFSSIGAEFNTWTADFTYMDWDVTVMFDQKIPLI